ncbi:MAG: hypothetical protein EOP34_06270 [Rickettsiales bacterium]|nr:MAG: hypothetical protein EOP34_06270 [Rickettsiales bacterium]
MEQTINSKKSRRDNHVKMTYMRQSLIASIQELSDREYQKREWLSDSNGYKFYYSLYMVLAFLFNDFSLDENIEVQIGNIIRNKEEAEVISKVIIALDRIIDEVGEKQPDAAYWESELWRDVVYKAKVAYEYIKMQGLDKRRIERIERLSK